MKRYDFGRDVIYEKAKLLLRMRKRERHCEFSEVGMKSIDDLFGGGLRKGLNLFVGGDGTGKSMWSKIIARSFAKRGKKVLYVISEDLVDNPNYAGVETMDYTEYLPNARNAINEVLGAVQEFEYDIVFIDSLTNLLGGTNKAVSEADIRENTFYLSKKINGIIPFVVTSQMRGDSWEKRTAGGLAVYHAPIITLMFDNFLIKTKEVSDVYKRKIGERIWTVYVRKDREGEAICDRIFEVQYNKEKDNILLFELC
jgi:hypothetical protein